MHLLYMDGEDSTKHSAPVVRNVEYVTTQDEDLLHARVEDAGVLAEMFTAVHQRLDSIETTLKRLAELIQK
jgi:hypothetical protein